jgi:hypothetical protein
LNTLTVYAKPRLDEVVAHHRAAFAHRPAADGGQRATDSGYDRDDLDTVFGRL